MEKIKIEKTYKVQIYLAADLNMARQVCRQYCFDKNLCLTIRSTDFVYKGGLESGIMVELLNYPRFPMKRHQIWASAEQLAKTLKNKCFQDTCLITDDKKTMWISTREHHL